MYDLPFTSLYQSLRYPSAETLPVTEREFRNRNGSELVCGAQPLITNYLNVLVTFGMPFGECPLHMTFCMQTTQREAALLHVATRWSLNLTSWNFVG